MVWIYFLLLALCTFAATQSTCPQPPCPQTAQWAYYVDQAGCCASCPRGYSCPTQTQAIPCLPSNNVYAPSLGLYNCVPLTTCSIATSYESRAPTPTTNRVCSNLTTCRSDLGYESGAPTATTDRACACRSGHVGTYPFCSACVTSLQFCARCVSDTQCIECWDGYVVSAAGVCVRATTQVTETSSATVSASVTGTYHAEVSASTKQSLANNRSAVAGIVVGCVVFIVMVVMLPVLIVCRKKDKAHNSGIKRVPTYFHNPSYKPPLSSIRRPEPVYAHIVDPPAPPPRNNNNNNNNNDSSNEYLNPADMPLYDIATMQPDSDSIYVLAAPNSDLGFHAVANPTTLPAEIMDEPSFLPSETDLEEYIDVDLS